MRLDADIQLVTRRKGMAYQEIQGVRSSCSGSRVELIDLHLDYTLYTWRCSGKLTCSYTHLYRRKSVPLVVALEPSN